MRSILRPVAFLLLMGTALWIGRQLGKDVLLAELLKKTWEPPIPVAPETLPPHLIEEVRGPLAQLAGSASRPLSEEVTKDISALITHLNQAIGDNNLPYAVRLAEVARAALPEDQHLRQVTGDLYSGLAVSAFNQNNFAEALPLFERALELHPGESHALAGLGMTYLHLGDLDKADKELQAANAASPNQADILFGLGELQFRRNDPQGALTYWQALLDKNPGIPHLRQRIEQTRRDAEMEAAFPRFVATHFLISYDPSAPHGLVNETANVLEETYRTVGQQFQYFPTQLIPVVIYTSQNFQAVTAANAWVGAIFDGKIRVPLGGKTPSDPEVKTKLAHEYTHAVVECISGPYCPTWLNEGLAQLMEGRRTSRQKTPLFFLVMKAGTLVQLENLEGSFMNIPDADAANLAYEESLAATEYLWYRYGRQAVFDILERVGPEKQFDSVLESVISKNSQELMREAVIFYQQAKDR